MCCLTCFFVSLTVHCRLFTGCLTCRVHVFDPVRQFHMYIHIQMCVFSAESTQTQFERAPFYPRNQAVVINSFVDNKSMGCLCESSCFVFHTFYQIHTFTFKSIHTKSRSILLDTCNMEMNCFMASTDKSTPHKCS